MTRHGRTQRDHTHLCHVACVLAISHARQRAAAPCSLSLSLSLSLSCSLSLSLSRSLSLSSAHPPLANALATHAAASTAGPSTSRRRRHGTYTARRSRRAPAPRRWARHQLVTHTITSTRSVRCVPPPAPTMPLATRERTHRGTCARRTTHTHNTHLAQKAQ